jgi:hypothetical protein
VLAMPSRLRNNQEEDMVSLTILNCNFAQLHLLPRPKSAAKYRSGQSLS